MDYASCPKCQSTQAAPVTFTWWGGLIGPKLLSHVKCNQCGTKYNGKSGRSNTAGIVVYTVVGIPVVLFAVGWVLGIFR
jgi:hypothetical protein